jgi:uncharacterized protein with HEPN domain
MTPSMPSKDPDQRLRDIAENIEAVRTFTAGMDFAAYARDQKTLYAVTRALEIISEASRRLPEEIKARHPSIDWRAVAAAGNVYRHDYESVRATVIWQTVTQGLEASETAVNEELARLGRGNST